MGGQREDSEVMNAWRLLGTFFHNYKFFYNFHGRIFSISNTDLIYDMCMEVREPLDAVCAKNSFEEKIFIIN